MKCKFKEFFTWLDLASRANAQRGNVRYWYKKYSRLYDELSAGSGQRNISDYSADDDIPCFICPVYSENNECRADCSYRLLNNMYLRAKTAYTDATKDYEQLLAKRKAAWETLVTRKKQH